MAWTVCGSLAVALALACSGRVLRGALAVRRLRRERQASPEASPPATCTAALSYAPHSKAGLHGAYVGSH